MARKVKTRFGEIGEIMKGQKGKSTVDVLIKTASGYKKEQHHRSNLFSGGKSIGKQPRDSKGRWT